MAFPSSNYAPPSVYTRTNFESPIQGTLAGAKIPFLIGVGSEILTQSDLEVVRGSSAVVDQQIVQEDMAGRVVVSELQSGEVVLGSYDGETAKIQVRNYPIVTGNGTGTTSTKPSDVSVVLNGNPVVVIALDGAKGILTLSEIPKENDILKVTYFFNRTDTLVTDDVSSQVSSEGVALFSQKAENYSFESGVTDTLVLIVDGTTLAIPMSGSSVSAAQAVAQIKSGAGSTSLSATTFVNNEGNTAVSITADSEIIIGDGGANVVLGFAQGESSGRVKTFYTFNGPIVDGSNGGVVTTDTAHVVVKVDNIQVIPQSVDGYSRAVTLSVPPAAGSTVTIQYHFNTWEDTFDYLAHTGITEISLVGETPSKATFINGVDYILKDDKIIWGTATLVESGDYTQGGTLFGENQVTSTLVDHKAYFEPCSAVVDTSVSPAIASKTKFQLPFVPTTGNGRNTPIGLSLFQTVSNGRIDLPTNRPDLVKAYWGYSAQDAMDRGEVAIVSVDHETSTITLKDPIPTGASVWATLYYNTIQDTETSIVCSVAGISGVGEYSLQDSNGNPIHIPQFVEKSASLATVTVNFPSGSELLSDVRFEAPHVGTNFKGQVEEIVTVTFTSTEDTPAKYALKSVSPFAFISGNSDTLKLNVNSSDKTIELNTSFEAHLLGDEIVYTNAGYTALEISAGVNDNLVLTIDGQQVDVTLTAGTGKAASDFVSDINTAVDAVNPTFTGLTKFLVGFTIVNGVNDELTFKLSSGDVTITLTAATYSTASDLVDHINAIIAAEATGKIAKLTGNNTSSATDPTEARIEASVNTLGQIVFTFAESNTPSATSCSFNTSEKLAQQIGLDASVITFDADYVAASFASITGTGSEKFHDRLILKNRIEPKGYIGMAQSGISVDVCTAISELGLQRGDYGIASTSAVVKAATVIGEIGLSGTQDAVDSDVLVTLYQSGGTTPQNNIFKLNVDGTPFTIELKDNAGSSITSGSSADVKFEIIVSQLNTAITNATVTREGFSIRITSNTTGASSAVIIGDGNANNTLGFSQNQSGSRSLVSTSELVSCIAGDGDWTGLVQLLEDEAGTEYVFLQSTTTGTSSNVSVSSASGNTALRQGTNFVDEAGDGAVGESGVSGFVVSSSDSFDGSGSVNNSVLSGTGVGQDGVVGQTYRDLVTGLTFTVLPRDTGTAYPSGGTLTFQVSKSATTDANIPVYAIAGVALSVANTSNVVVGDSAVVSTFKRTGAQPEISDNYFVSYNYAKQDFQPRVFTKFGTVESLYGELDPSNPLTLACYLAMTNGASLVGIQQVQKDEMLIGGSFAQASVTNYRDAVDSLAGTLQGGISADILIPLRGDSLELYKYIARHANLQSSIRYRSERTVIAGFAAGTQRETAQNWAKAIQETRFRLVYPDIVYVTTTDQFGNDTQHLVGGEYMAAALAGLVVSPNRDVATPWTNSRLFGFDNLARVSDAVQKNQLASAGITVIEDANPALKIRHGLTTDMANVLTKTPTVIQIADEVQQTCRVALDKFIGIKFLPGILSQVEGTLAMTMKEFVRQEVITAYTGIKANISPDDPTVAEVEAYYQPVFPLLYLVVTFNMRASL